MSRFLREPLLHFLVLGGLIFLAYSRLADTGSGQGDEILVSLAQQRNLANTFERTWQRPPTQAELEGIITDFIRQEIAYRESQAMQLDRDDIVIRRRLRQKLEMLTEDLASMAPPTDEDLQQFLDANADAFRVPGVTTFRHVFFNTDEDDGTARERAMTLLAALRGGSAVDLESAGDQTLLPAHLERFAADIWALEPERWHGPVESAFGLHLVYIEERTDGRNPELDEVINRVTREWLARRRGEAIDRLYEQLSENYTITIEAPPDILPATPGDAGAAR